MSTMSLSGTSLWCGPCVEAQQMCMRMRSGGMSLHRVVERLDVGGDHLAELFEAQMREHHVAAQGEVRAIELQHEAGVDDGAVFARHHVGERVEIGLRRSGSAGS